MKREENIPTFEHIGWNRVEDASVFCVSNCCITATGVDYIWVAKTKGFNLYLSEFFGKDPEGAKKRYLELALILDRGRDILWPILWTTVAAPLNGILRKKNHSPALTAIIEGEPGSGKSSLAITVGSFLNKNAEDFSQEGNNVFYAFNKAKYLPPALMEHRDINFILDDVKREHVSGQRYNNDTCVDVCIRSVYEQRLVEVFTKVQEPFLGQPVTAGAIITGEEIRTYKSSLERCFYLKVDDLVNDPTSSRALKKLQDNPYILSDFMTYYIMFLCSKLKKGEDYIIELTEAKDKFWEESKEVFYGTSASRLAKTLSSMKLVIKVLADFAHDCGADRSMDMKDFVEKNTKLAVEVMKRTEQRVENEDVVLLNAFQEVLKELSIQIPDDIYWEGTLQVEPYIIRNNQDGIWIPDINRFRGIRTESECPVLICRQDRLETKLISMIIKQVNQRRYSGPLDLKITNTRLRNAGIIYGALRSDSTYNNVIPYPYYIGWEGKVEECNCFCLVYNSRIMKSLVDSLRKQAEQKGIEDYYELPLQRQYDLESCIYGWREFGSSVRKIDEFMKKVKGINEV